MILCRKLLIWSMLFIAGSLLLLLFSVFYSNDISRADHNRNIHGDFPENGWYFWQQHFITDHSPIIILRLGLAGGVAVSSVDINTRKIDCSARGASGGNWQSAAKFSGQPNNAPIYYFIVANPSRLAVSDLRQFDPSRSDPKFGHGDKLCFRVKYTKSNQPGASSPVYIESLAYDNRAPRLTFKQETKFGYSAVKITVEDETFGNANDLTWLFNYDDLPGSAACPGYQQGVTYPIFRSRVQQTQTNPDPVEVQARRLYLENAGEVDQVFKADPGNQFAYSYGPGESKEVVIYIRPDVVLNNRRVCVLVQDRYANTNIKGFSIDLTPPDVMVTQELDKDNQNQGQITFKITDPLIKSQSAAQFITTHDIKSSAGVTSNADCSSRTSFRALPAQPATNSYVSHKTESEAFSASFKFSRSDAGKFVCFALHDGNGNYVYKKHPIDFSPPRIALKYQSRDIIVVERLNRFGSNVKIQEVDLLDPDRFLLSDSVANIDSATKCRLEDQKSQNIFDGTGFLSGWSDGISLRAGRNDDYTHPNPELQVGDQRRFCFRAIDGNLDFETNKDQITYIYHRFVIYPLSVSQPKIRISSSNNVLRATISSSVPNAQKILPNSLQYIYAGNHNPGDKCVGYDYAAAKSSDSDYSIKLFGPNDGDNHYYCLRATNWAGSTAYVAGKISGSGRRPVAIGLEPKTEIISPPQIKVVINKPTITASASNIDQGSWRYVISDTNPDCLDPAIYKDAKKGRIITLTEAQQRKDLYVCFKVTDGSGIITVYKEDFIAADGDDDPGDSSTTTVIPVQQGIILDEEDDSDDKKGIWKYVVVDSQEKCVASAFDEGAIVAPVGEVIDAKADQDKKYICLMLDRGDSSPDIQIIGFSSGDITKITGDPSKTTKDLIEESKKAKSDYSGGFWLFMVVVFGLAIIALVNIKKKKPPTNNKRRSNR